MFHFFNFIALDQFVLLLSCLNLVYCSQVSLDHQQNVYPSFANYDSYLTAPQYAVGKKRANNLDPNNAQGKYGNPKVFNIGSVLDRDELIQDFVQVIN